MGLVLAVDTEIDMAMGHFRDLWIYECSHCGRDLEEGSCKRPQCLEKRRKAKEKIRQRNIRWKDEEKTKEMEQLTLDLNDRRIDE